MTFWADSILAQSVAGFNRRRCFHAPRFSQQTRQLRFSHLFISLLPCFYAISVSASLKSAD
ncbi:MAG TPA: hypothetical protein VM095_19775, partial [Pyrinomonadaceae bacterium]|nr:hypothetical protein [Pyrinomonadaceae bacterium]